MYVCMNIYKYTKACHWKSWIKEKRIRFTLPSSFNDPFEFLPVLIKNVSNVEIEAKYSDKIVSMIFGNCMLRRIRVKRSLKNF